MNAVIKIILIILIVFIVDYVLHRISQYKEKTDGWASAGSTIRPFFINRSIKAYLSESTTHREDNHRFISDEPPVDTVGKGIDLIKADGYSLCTTLGEVLNAQEPK